MVDVLTQLSCNSNNNTSKRPGNWVYQNKLYQKLACSHPAAKIMYFTHTHTSISQLSVNNHLFYDLAKCMHKCTYFLY